MNRSGVESYGTTPAIASSYWSRDGVSRSSSYGTALDRFWRSAGIDSGNQPTSILSIRRVVERGSTARFVCGVVLDDGRGVARFDDRLFSVPLRLLWENA